MDTRNIWHWVLLAIIAFIAIKLVLWVLNIFLGILHTVVIVAIIFAIVYALYSIFSRRRSAY